MRTKTVSWAGILLLGLVVQGKCEEQSGKTAKTDASRTAPKVKYQWYGFDVLDIHRAVIEELAVQLSSTVQSEHIWHGFDLLDDHAVYFPAATLTFGDSGFSGKIIGACALSDGYENSDELNFAGFYSGTLLETTRYATDYTLNYFYYGKPNQGGRRADAQELGVSVSWAKLLGDNGLLPNYYFGRLWPTRSHCDIEGAEGFIHVFGLAYDLEIADFWPNGQQQCLRFSSDITYNDGFGGGEHDWSHVVLGVSTNLGSGKVTITPYLNYQLSMEDSVNSEDEMWTGIGIAYRF